ncbi:MAG: alpha/beta fold hydrolase [Acidimicrobiales bacterium]
MTLFVQPGRVVSGDDDIYFELIHQGETDDRPLVALTHGAGGSHASWFQQAPVLGQTYRVLTWDSRGFGNSSARGGVSAEAAASDLGLVLDAVGVDAAHLVGQSMGGWWVTEFAVRNPARVRSLALCDTIGALFTPALDAHFTEFRRAGGLGVGPNGAQELGRHRAISPATADRDPTLGFLYQQLGSFFTPPMREVGEALRAARRSHEEVAALGAPVLFLVGAQDEIFPPPLVAESAMLIPGSQYVEIPDAGHSPYFEQPEAFNHALMAFLAGVG